MWYHVVVYHMGDFSQLISGLWCWDGPFIESRLSSFSPKPCFSLWIMVVCGLLWDVIAGPGKIWRFEWVLGTRPLNSPCGMYETWGKYSRTFKIILLIGLATSYLIGPCWDLQLWKEQRFKENWKGLSPPEMVMQVTAQKYKMIFAS